MMKKARLLVALLAMLVAASGYAQDSYRTAVKDYLSASGQIETTQSLISGFSMLFDKNGPVDIGQLTQRYIDEQFENDFLDFMVPILTGKDATEAELKEVSSLLSMPQKKTFDEHQKEWMSGFLTDMLMPFMSIGEEMVADEDMDLSSGGLTKLLGQPIQAREDIDPAYAEKFKNVMLESPLSKSMLEAMMKRYNETPDDETEDDFMKQEERKGYADWINLSWPNLLLNNAYGTLTLEDLDYADLLYSNEAYCKVVSFDAEADEELKAGNVLLKYMEWMEQQGAKKSEDPGVIMEFFKSLMNLSGVNLDSDTPYDIDIEE